jgi:hypothetical protein
MRRHRHSTPKTHNCTGFPGLYAPLPNLSALTAIADFQANSWKSLNLRADEFAHPTTHEILPNHHTPPVTLVNNTSGGTMPQPFTRTTV